MRKGQRRAAILALAMGLAAALPAGAEAPRLNMFQPRVHGPADVQVAAPGQPSCRASTRDELSAAVRATNAARRAVGLAPLRANARLARAAAQHACDMAARGRMAHAGSRTTGPTQRVKALGYRPAVTAENIAAGPFDLTRVLAEWTRSQGHRANILIPQVREFGIGRAVGADGRTVFWAAVYAAPR